MSIKGIEKIITPSAKHWVGDGFYVHNIIPGSQGLSMKRMDPFLMLDYNAPHHFPPTHNLRGVDVHPHRGFETVTIAYQGKVKHTDSSGGGGVIDQGDVQWMTAASGVLHKEFHEENFSRAGGLFQMAQLWVNLPAKDKMNAPGYQAIKNEKLSKIGLPNDAGRVELIAGHYGTAQGPARTHTPVHLSNAYLQPGGQATYTFPAHWNVAVLVVEGSVLVNESAAKQNQFVLMDNEGEDFVIQGGNEGALALIMAGEPINEPIVAHGPFVMNTHQEIVQAINDFNSGKFGYLD